MPQKQIFNFQEVKSDNLTDYGVNYGTVKFYSEDPKQKQSRGEALKGRWRHFPLKPEPTGKRLMERI